MTLEEKLYLFENQSMSYYIYTFIFVQEKYKQELRTLAQHFTISMALILKWDNLIYM